MHFSDNIFSITPKLMVMEQVDSLCTRCIVSAPSSVESCTHVFLCNWTILCNKLLMGTILIGLSEGQSGVDA